MKQRLPNYFVLIVLFVYGILALVLVLHHEPWRDEADAWLMARDAGVSDMYRFARCGGTPMLWYGILAPFARTGFPYATEGIIHLIIAIGAVAVFLQRAPLPKPIKVLFVFSYYMSFQYAVISRSYSLGILFLFLTAALHEKRLERPCLYGLTIALLANTNVHSAIPAGLLFALFLWDATRARRIGIRQGIGLAVMFLGGMLAVAQLWPMNGGQYSRFFASSNPLAVQDALGNAFLPMLPGAVTFPIGLFILFAATIAWLEKPRALTVLYGTWICHLAILVYIWNGGLRHYGLLLAIFVFAYWISHREEDHVWLVEGGGSLIRHYAPMATRFTLGVCLAFSCCVASKFWYLEINSDFSDAKEMGEFIREKGLDKYTIAAHKAPFCAAVLPYLAQKQFWYPAEERYGSYMLWDQRYVEGLDMSYVDAMNQIREKFTEPSNLLILLNQRLPDPQSWRVKLLFATDGRQFGWRGEVFCLYQALPGFSPSGANASDH